MKDVLLWKEAKQYKKTLKWISGKYLHFERFWEVNGETPFSVL